MKTYSVFRNYAVVTKNVLNIVITGHEQATYDWFQKIRAVQAEQEALYKHFLARIHAAYRDGWLGN